MAGGDRKDNLGLDDAWTDDGDDGLASALLEALGQGPAPEKKEPEPERKREVTGVNRAVPAQQPKVDPNDSAVLLEPAEAGPGEVVCPSCSTVNPSDNRFCGSCGATLVDINRRRRPPPETTTGARQETDADIELVSINEDGSDGIRIPLRYTETIVGRSGDTRFPTDAFLSPEHARLVIEEDGLFIEDLYSLNGTFIRIRDEVRLSPGDCFLMGRQVLRFERFEQTVTPKARSADGTRYMGSPPPGGQYKILQVGIGGVYQNVYCLSESGAVLGREKGDIVFPRDRFMSSRHAQIYPRDDGHYYLVDLNSSNGTWTKIWDRFELDDGDLIFLGQQLFRVEVR